MKVFISADLEGVAGIAAWDETDKGSSVYPYFAEQMTKEVIAVCTGANLAGAKEIVVKDAHETGRNIDPRQLPENVKLIRGWTGHPFAMVQGLDESFDAVAFIGYHSGGGTNANPLAHTMNSSSINYVKLNGEILSEFRLHAYIAAYLGVPVALLSGDQGICAEAKKLNANIATVATFEGLGSATKSIHPKRAAELIKAGMQEVLIGDLSLNKIDLPEKFSLEISYNFHGHAYSKSFYPGTKQISPKSITFETNDYFEIVRAISFLI